MANDRVSILNAIRQAASECGGQAPGQVRFEQLSGIPVAAWRGKYWARWSDAVAEAGFLPNKTNEATPTNIVLESLARLALKVGHIPTYGEVRLARQQDSSFPAHQVINRLGSKLQREALLRDLAQNSEQFHGLIALLPTEAVTPESEKADPTDGFVYMARMGKHYKIGKTFSVPRRHREIAVHLPESLTAIHSIRTDDPTGIEAYWHKRFESKRTNGEWFSLSLEDIRAFKRRRFM